MKFEDFKGILTFDLSFFDWSSVGLLALSYFLLILIGALGFIVMRLKGGSLIPRNRRMRLWMAVMRLTSLLIRVITVTVADAKPPISNKLIRLISFLIYE